MIPLKIRFNVQTAHCILLMLLSLGWLVVAPCWRIMAFIRNVKPSPCWAHLYASFAESVMPRWYAQLCNEGVSPEAARAYLLKLFGEVK